MENTCEHPIVFLKDIKISEVRAILDYMYKGEVNVAQEELPGLLKVAELLRVKGLVEGESEKLLNSHIGKNGRPLVSTSINDPPTSSSKLNGGDVRDRSEDRRSTSDSKDSPNGAPAGMRPFMPGMPQLPMPFGLPGMFPNLLGARDGHRREDRDDKDREGSPSPGSGNKRRKVASGSGGSCSSKESGTLGHQDVQPPNMAAMDLGRPKERTDDEHDFDKEAMLSMSGGLGKPDLANYVPNQRLEWKRYKQYTRNDIMSAIEEVKNGMSALQASRKYGVPSRTLYDKVKKMGITTGRQVQRKSLPNYPSQFPGLMMNNMNDDLDDTNDSSGGAPGDAMDGRATMVPPSGLNYMLDFMKMRAEHHGKTEAGEVSLTPMNLTTMLSGNSAKRSSEQSLSPHSPVSRSGQHHSSSRDLDDEQVDSSNDRTRDRRSSGDRELDRESHQPSMKDLQSQFFADLKRLGSNIPTQSNSQNDSQATPSSTTHSPPAPGTPSKMEEENLPPRKRKVSQEHQKSPFNGLHEVAANERGPGHPTGAENDNSVDCRN